MPELETVLHQIWAFLCSIPRKTVQNTVFIGPARDVEDGDAQWPGAGVP